MTTEHACTFLGHRRFFILNLSIVITAHASLRYFPLWLQVRLKAYAAPYLTASFSNVALHSLLVSFSRQFCRWSDAAVEDIRKTKVCCPWLLRGDANPDVVLQVIFFAKDANLQMLSKAAQYVIKNESGLWLVVVHFFDDEHSPMLQELANNISVLVK